MKKMGRRFILGTAMAAAGAFLSACFPQPNVYGPPPDLPEDPATADTTVYETFLEETDSSSLAAEIDTQIESILESETFDPETNVNEPVYGPPEVFN